MATVRSQKENKSAKAKSDSAAATSVPELRVTVGTLSEAVDEIKAEFEKLRKTGSL